MLAAFNGVKPDQLTPAMKYFPNEATKHAWENVSQATLDALKGAPRK